MERFEDLIQLLVMLIEAADHLSLKVIKPLLKRFIGAGNSAKLNKRPHDRDVHGDGSVAAEDPGEHRYSLLGEGKGATSAPSMLPT